MQLPRRQIWAIVHRVPHMPQLLRSLFVSTHAVPQSVVPRPHAVQTPIAHVPPQPQLLPQAPQLKASPLVSMQRKPQRVWPVGQAARQAPPEHT